MILEHVKHAFTGPTAKKILSKITSRAVVVPLTYSITLVFVFALVYSLIGYKNHFVVDENSERNGNVGNSIVASIMLQSNAMGSVTPKTKVGTALSTLQVCLSWLWFLSLVYVMVDVHP